MSKEFIPYEQAVALKELGFNEPCFAVYSEYDKTKVYDQSFIKEGLKIPAPLYQQAFRWFREKHNLIGLVDGGYDNSKNIFTYVIWNDFRDDIFDDYYFTYEEAEFKCLIKLIEIAKRNKEEDIM
jgi:hypothetical protein